MDLALTSTADARNNMVDGQLRPNRVTDKRLLDAMRRLPREAFAPARQRELAYADVEVPLPNGRVLLSPMVVARLLQAMELPPGAKALVLGAGYAAAVLAAAGATVIALEEDPALIETARAAFAACGVDVPVINAPLAAGWGGEAPYDGIFIDGAVPALPPLAAQLQPPPRGRLGAILAVGDGRGVAVLAERAGDVLAQRPLFDCAATVLPHFAARPAFTF